MDITRITNHPIGMGAGAGTMRDALSAGIAPAEPKMWVDLAIMAAAAISSAIAGGISASNARKRAQREQKNRESEEQNWYNKRYNEHYVDTAVGQNLVNRAKEYAREQTKRAEGIKTVTGGTDAATAIAKEQGNKMVGDTIADIAANDVARRDNIDRIHQQMRSQFAQQNAALEMQKAQDITNATQQASNAMMTAAGALGQGSVTNKNLAGASNNSKVKIDTPANASANEATRQSVHDLYHKAPATGPTEEEMVYWR